MVLGKLRCGHVWWIVLFWIRLESLINQEGVGPWIDFLVRIYMLFQGKRYKLSAVVSCSTKSILLFWRLLVREEEVLDGRISYIVFVVVGILIDDVFNELLSEK